MNTEETEPYKTSVVAQSDKHNSTFTNHILESRVDPNRFTPTRHGTKEPPGTWEENHPDEVGRDSLIETGNGLLVIDVDRENETPHWVWDLVESNATLSVQSPHAEGREGHYYYLTDEEIDTRNPPWGEIRCEGALVVTPGTQLTDCQHGCCTEDEPGQYTVKRDLPVAPIDTSDLPDPPEERITEGVNPGNFDSDLKQRIEYGRTCNEDFDSLCRWASKGGDGGERSERECILTWHLSFWLENDENAVRKALNYLNPPKWSERGENYRESVLEYVDVQPECYEKGGGESGPSQELVVDVYYHLMVGGPYKTSEVAELVDGGETQTRKTLEYLADKELVEYKRDGRSGAWYLVIEDWDIISTIEEELNSIMTMVEFREGMKNHGG